MNNIDWTVPLIVALIIAVVALLAGAFYQSSQSTAEFKKVCEKTGGVVVHDTRQYQCLKGPQQ